VSTVELSRFTLGGLGGGFLLSAPAGHSSQRLMLCSVLRPRRDKAAQPFGGGKNVAGIGIAGFVTVGDAHQNPSLSPERSAAPQRVPAPASLLGPSSPARGPGPRLCLFSVCQSPSLLILPPPFFSYYSVVWLVVSVVFPHPGCRG